MLLEGVRSVLGTDFGLDTGGSALDLAIGELDEGRKLFEASANGQEPGRTGFGHVCVEGATLQRHHAIQVGTKLVQKREVKGIYLLQGMSRVHAAKVLAHEITHVYMAKNKYHSLPLQVEEGVCELVSYLWLAEMVDRVRDRSRAVPRRRGIQNNYDGGLTATDLITTEETLKEAVSQLRRMEGNMNPTYGLGFRRAHAALQGRSLGELLAYVKEHKDFPPLAVPLPASGQFLACGNGAGGPPLAGGELGGQVERVTVVDAPRLV